jgi:hypothetical protein
MELNDRIQVALKDSHGTCAETETLFLQMREIKRTSRIALEKSREMLTKLDKINVRSSIAAAPIEVDNRRHKSAFHERYELDSAIYFEVKHKANMLTAVLKNVATANQKLRAEAAKEREGRLQKEGILKKI